MSLGGIQADSVLDLDPQLRGILGRQVTCMFSHGGYPEIAARLWPLFVSHFSGRFCVLGLRFSYIVMELIVARGTGVFWTTGSQINHAS